MATEVTTQADRAPIVIDCPVCSRTIWTHSVCHHGKVPETMHGAPKEVVPTGKLKGGVDHTGRKL